MKVTAMDQVTTGTAVGAVASPAILPVIETVSTFAALWLPVLGAVWLVVQITRAIRTWPSKDDKQPK